MKGTKTSTVVYGLTDLNRLEKEILKEALETARAAEVYRLIDKDFPMATVEVVDTILNAMFKVLSK